MAPGEVIISAVGLLIFVFLSVKLYRREKLNNQIDLYVYEYIGLTKKINKLINDPDLGNDYKMYLICQTMTPVDYVPRSIDFWKRERDRLQLVIESVQCDR